MSDAAPGSGAFGSLDDAGGLEIEPPSDAAPGLKFRLTSDDARRSPV